MKELLIIPVTLFVVGSIFLAACGNNTTDAAMKVPLQNNEDYTTQNANQEDGENEGSVNEEIENEKSEKAAIAKLASSNTKTDATVKTIDNMQAAFQSETIASEKYAAYSKKAEQEGYHQIALLFKAASSSENIHANNHKAVLQESGAAVPAIKPEYTVLTTRENLQDAIVVESYEVAKMYPEFLTAANEAGHQLAMISLNYAYKTENVHKVFYETALTALQSNTVKSMSAVFYVCPTCGNTYGTYAPARCVISMTSREKFIKIN